MPFVYPSEKYKCARCWSTRTDKALIVLTLLLPDNRPFEYWVGKERVKTNMLRILVCYDHAEEVINYLTGRGRKLSKVYPVDEKQRMLTSTEYGLW